MKKWMAIVLALAAAFLSAAPAFAAQYGGEDHEYALRVQADPMQTMLDVGSRGELVADLQARLVALGFLTGKADGVYGAKTGAAVSDVKEYLQDLGLAGQYIDDMQPQTAVSSALLAMLIESEFETGGRTLKTGDDGPAVARLQKRLTALGYPADADGVYGERTAYGVSLYRYFDYGGDGGYADQDLRYALFSDKTQPAQYPPLGRGSSGAAVKALQNKLRLAGFLSSSADGSYGAKTEEAVTLLKECLAVRGYSADASAGADPYLQQEFLERFELAPSALAQGDTGPEVARMQRRLTLYGFGAGAGDGEYGAATAAALKRFQKRNGLTADGVAGIETLTKLYSADIKGALKGYLVKISLKNQKTYVYGLDDNYEYTVLVRSMNCSTGLADTPTPRGTFTNTGPGLRWHYFTKYECWAQYAYYINGNIMFHSVLYSDNNEDTLLWGSVYNLGSPASHGCVRLAVEDAKWIYRNCAAGTTVVVY